MKKEIEVTLFIEQKVKLYDNGLIEVKSYKKPIEKLKEGYEPLEDDNSLGRVSSSKINDREVRKDSLFRSKKILMDYAYENERYFISFVTLTFSENISIIENANNDFRKFVTSMRRTFSDFKYLGVPEFQKRGAVHYHLLTNLTPGSELCPLQEGQKDKYDVKYWNYGFSSVFDLKSTDEKFNIALYITKYLTKDFDSRLFGRTKVLKSNNLDKPLEIDIQRTDNTYNLSQRFIDKNELFYSEKEVISNRKYSVPFVLTSCKTTHDNVEKLKKLYKEGNENE